MYCLLRGGGGGKSALFDNATSCEDYIAQLRADETWIWVVIGMRLTGEEGSTYRETVQIVHHNLDSSIHVRNACFATKTTGWDMTICRVSSTIRAVSKPVWHVPLLCVQWKTPDDGQRKCPKHVEFYSKNEFEKLVHLDDFIIRTFI